MIETRGASLSDITPGQTTRRGRGGAVLAPVEDAVRRLRRWPVAIPRPPLRVVPRNVAGRGGERPSAEPGNATFAVAARFV